MLLQFGIVVVSLAIVATESNFYDYTVQDADGNPYDLSQHRGKVSLVTNVASYCGFTNSHYAAFVKFQEEFAPILNVLAFPCNQFGEQEPETVKTIIANMKAKYRVNFPIFNKIKVVGSEVPDAWVYLTEKSHREPRWNFHSYLVDGNGRVIGAWSPQDSLEEEIRPAIARAVRHIQQDGEL